MENNKIEYRKFELRYDDILQPTRTISGLAIPVESRSQLLGGSFYETISRTAVTEELIRNNDVRLFVDHLPERGTLARSKYGEGSLRLSVEDDGLHFETELPKTALGDEILEGIRRGDFDSMSFGFICGEDNWSENTDGTYNREIRSISRLMEASILSQAPAYLATDVALRSLDEYKAQQEAEKREQEKQAEIEKEQAEQEAKRIEELNQRLKTQREMFNAMFE